MAQCKCKTLKGIRCSRMGKYNGYCYQHSKSQGGKCKNRVTLILPKQSVKVIN